jgi:hypothetical protein
VLKFRSLGFLRPQLTPYRRSSVCQLYGLVTATKINPSKTRQLVSREPEWRTTNYSLGNQEIMEASSCKYLGIILHSDLSWAAQVSYRWKKPGRHYILQCVFSKREIVTIKFSLHITSVSVSWICGCVLGYLRVGTNKCVRPGAKEIGYFCTSYEWFKLGILGTS